MAVSLVGFGGECRLDLGDEVGVVEAGGLAERRGHGAVDAAHPDLRVRQVDEGVAGGVQAGDGGAERRPSSRQPTSPVSAPRPRAEMSQRSRATASLWAAEAIQRPGGDGRAERHAGEAVVGLQVRDHRCSFPGRRAVPRRGAAARGAGQPLAALMASVTRAMLRVSRLPRLSRRLMAMPGSARLAAMRRMACSEVEQGSWPFSRAWMAAFHRMTASGCPVVTEDPAAMMRRNAGVVQEVAVAGRSASTAATSAQHARRRRHTAGRPAARRARVSAFTARPSCPSWPPGPPTGSSLSSRAARLSCSPRAAASASGDQLEVVDAGQGGGGGVLVRRGLGVRVPADDLRDGPADLAALPVHGRARSCRTGRRRSSTFRPARNGSTE